MANTDWNQLIREEVDAIKGGGKSPSSVPVCQAGDLKGLLNTIVEQISDADRRHTDTLIQMQDRLTSMGREAVSLRAKVPPQFAAAFDRIEAGMADLAHRIAEAGDHRTVHGDHAEMPNEPASVPSPRDEASAVRPAATAFAIADEPQALRTASGTASPRRRDDVDTFDVIETSLPGNVSDPWDRDAAEALAGIYDTTPTSYGLPGSEPSAHRSYTTPMSMAMSPMSAAGVDQEWLESRFADISKRIEQSLSEMNPDHGFFALNQRVEQLENHFTGLIEGVATRGDVEGIRLIEAHISELATHLESAHNQLMRLDGIEQQLADVAMRLDDVHRIAASSTGEGSPVQAIAGAQIDIDAVARAAAEHAASRFAALQPQAEPSEALQHMHGLIERFMDESRHGEENTTALLDTLQQAMIRLLDRVDAMEIAQHQSLQAQPAPQDYGHEHVRFNVEPGRHEPAHPGFAPADFGQSAQALDAAVAAVASAKSMSAPFAHTPGSDPQDTGEDELASQPRIAAPAGDPARGPEKLRQDFIADARRAKLKLAAEEGSEGGVVIAKPEAAEKPVAAKPEKRGDKAAASAKAKSGKPSASLPRLMAMGLGVMALLAGLYYVTLGSPAAVSALPPAAISAPVASQAPGKSENPLTEAQPGTEPSTAAPQSETPSNNRSDNTTNDTQGEIVTGEITDGATTLPMGGVAVDAGRTTAMSDIQRAKRQAAMAQMSGKIGQAASATALMTPAALGPYAANPQAAEPGTTSIEKNAAARSSPLDMPPATVGPLSLRLAAANGDPSAEFEVGARLAEGKGTGQNFEDAAKWYQRSADRGFVQSQYRLGTFYERGLGVKADLAKAALWYKRAAEQGNVKAMHNLAVLAANQSKGSPDYVTAATWFTSAADLGLSDSQFNLAVLYENGLGVAQDQKQAYKWLSLAARGGDKEAVRRRDILKGKLTGDELAQAEAMVSAWKGKVPNSLANDARIAGEAWKKNPANGVSG
jgi:localization factor PodJL